MFGQNDLEILANEAPSRPSERLAGYLHRHQGGHIICFGSEPPAHQRHADEFAKAIKAA